MTITRSLRMTLSALAIALICGGCAPKCFIKKDEQVDFYPTYIYQERDGRWAMPVTAWVHETATKGPAAQGIAKVVELAALFPSAAGDSQTLHEKVTPFLLRGASDRTVPIKLEQRTIPLMPSDADGYIRQDLVLPLQPPAVSSQAWVSYETPSCRDDSRIFRGQALVISQNGNSVIADLDTLLPPDRRWDPILERWRAEGNVFHYVSASPWQLFSSLSRQLENQGLPRGVLHLRSIPLQSMGDSVESLIKGAAALLGSPAAYKGPAITSLIERFPERHFTLLGDAAHEDAPLYADLGRRFPRQIVHIWIVDPSPSHGDRYRQMFHGLPDSVWAVIPDPTDIATR